MRRVLIVLGVLLVAAVTAAVLAFPRLAPGLVAGRLAAMGFAGATIARVEVGPTRAALVGVELGAGQSVGRIETGFRLAGLLGGRIDSLTVEDLHLRAALDGGRLTVPGWTPPPGGSGDGGTPPILPDRATIRGARIDLTTPEGVLRADLDAVLVREGEEVAVELDAARLTGEVLGGTVTARIDGKGLMAPFAEDPLRSLVAALTVEGEGHGLTVAQGIEAERTGGGASVDIADGVVTVGDLRLETVLQSLGEVGLPSMVGADPPVVTSLGRADDPGTVAIDLTGPGPVVTADLPLTARAGAVAVEAAIEGSVEIGAAGDLERVALERLDLQADRLELAGIGAVDAVTFSATGSGSGEAAAGEGRLRGRIAGARDGPFTGGVDLDLPVALALRPEAASLALTDGARLELSSVALPGLVHEVSGRVDLGRAGTSVVTIARPGLAWTMALPARLAGLRLEPDPASGVPALDIPVARLALALDGEGTRVGRGTVRLDGAEISAPGLQIALAGLDATVPVTASGLAPGEAVEVRVGTVRDLGSPPRFATLSGAATVTPSPDALTFAGRLEGAGREAPTVRFEGEHRPASGRGSATLVMEPLSFAPDGLQPRDLSPAHGGVVEQVAGTVGVAGEVTWTGGGVIGSDLELLVDELALTVGPARLEGVAGVVAVDGLRPPSTPPGQRLAVGLLDIGVPLTDGTVLFGLLPGGPLDVRRLRFAWAGGHVRADPFTIGSLDDVLSVVLHARGLDLDAIFAQVKLPGLRGDGTIDGRLPLRIEGAEAVVDGGELRARRPGWLRYRPDSVPDAVAAGGDGMALLLQALENFRYEDLRITLDGRTDAAMDIGLHLEGANPDLYDGHPVEFNLDLEGELANILEQGLRSYTLPDRVRERIEEYRSR